MIKLIIPPGEETPIIAKVLQLVPGDTRSKVAVVSRVRVATTKPILSIEYIIEIPSHQPGANDALTEIDYVLPKVGPQSRIVSPIDNRQGKVQGAKDGHLAGEDLVRAMERGKSNKGRVEQNPDAPTMMRPIVIDKTPRGKKRFSKD